MRHGKRPKIWPTVLGLLSSGLVLAAIIALIVIDPGKPEPVCRYASGSVTVEVDGPDCNTVIRFVVSDSDRAWVITKASQGTVYAQLENGKDVVRIYDHGEPAFAMALSGYFQKARWRVVAPTPAPS